MEANEQEAFGLPALQAIDHDSGDAVSDHSEQLELAADADKEAVVKIQSVYRGHASRAALSDAAGAASPETADGPNDKPDDVYDDDFSAANLEQEPQQTAAAATEPESEVTPDLKPEPEPGPGPEPEPEIEPVVRGPAGAAKPVPEPRLAEPEQAADPRTPVPSDAAPVPEEPTAADPEESELPKLVELIDLQPQDMGAPDIHQLANSGDATKLFAALAALEESVSHLFRPSSS